MAKRKRKDAVPAGEVAVAMTDPPPASLAEDTSTEIVRDEEGKWVKGQSGNPAGRIKGARNHLTIERLALEGALRSYIANPGNLGKLKQSIDRILDIAIEGEDKQAVAAFKVLADKVLTAPKDSAEADQQAPSNVTLRIENLTLPEQRERISVDIEDAKYEELED